MCEYTHTHTHALYRTFTIDSINLPIVQNYFNASNDIRSRPNTHPHFYDILHSFVCGRSCRLLLSLSPSPSPSPSVSASAASVSDVSSCGIVARHCSVRIERSWDERRILSKYALSFSAFQQTRPDRPDQYPADQYKNNKTYNTNNDRRNTT